MIISKTIFKNGFLNEVMCMSFTIKNMTIRKRIMFIFLISSMFLILILMAAFSYIEVKNSQERFEQLSRQTVNGLSFMPALTKAIKSNDYSEIQGIIDRVRLHAENPIVTVVDRDGIFIIHPDETKIGTAGEKSHFTQSLLFGSYITKEAEGAEGPSVMTTAPIYEKIYGGEQVVGAITVEYLNEDINATIIKKIFRLILVAIIGIIVCIGSALFLARSIQSDTLGFEPATIAGLFREREAMLDAVKEGIVVIDKSQNISMINPSAKKLVQTKDEQRELVKALGLLETFRKGESSYDKEQLYDGSVLITNRRPLYHGQEIVGAICSFRDKTDIKQLQETILQIQGYSDGLRAQAHEYKNKLYVLMGLLQIEHYDEALQFIEEETLEEKQAIPMLQMIEDPGVHAILLGKMAKAAEKKVTLVVGEGSRLGRTSITVSDMAIMLGNLLDNAIDAVLHAKQKKIEVMITDIGSEIVIDVQDTGMGLNPETVKEIFQTGFSSKGEQRGYGLSHVYETAKKYDGMVEVSMLKVGGTVFSLYLPKTKGET